ncbi:MAG: formate/nitrite transporter family protein [Rhodospirillales bacterium]|nr:formate/nitrite transporter family protein [Rhodospirillales bacterium]
MTDQREQQKAMTDEKQDPEHRFDPAMFDAYAPAMIADRIEAIGLNKAQMKTIPILTLVILAGAFISFGTIFCTLVITNSGLDFGTGRPVGGLSFCLGLILVVVGGAELFTGNVLIVMGWANRKISAASLARN